MLGFSLIFIISSCEKFPSNPDKNDNQARWVDVQHVGTEYITTETAVDGLAAKKVNLLSFQIEANHFEASAIEVFGRVILEGPPFEREHNLHFRTDKLLQVEDDGSEICLHEIRPESPVNLVRSKFPTNEYSPFIGNQGKVIDVIITNVIAYDSEGKAMDIPLCPAK